MAYIANTVLETGFQALKSATLADFVLMDAPTPEDIFRELNGIHTGMNDLTLAKGLVKMLSTDIEVEDGKMVWGDGNIEQGLSLLMYAAPDWSVRVIGPHRWSNVYILSIDTIKDIDSWLNWMVS